MNGKSTKSIAIILSCILILVNTAVEISHLHFVPQNTSINFTQDDSGQNALAPNKNHSYKCVACLFGMVQLAPALSSQSLKPDIEPIFTTLRKTLFYFIILTRHYDLRAPPLA